MIEDKKTVMLAILVEAFKAKSPSPFEYIVDVHDMRFLSNRRDKCIENCFTLKEVHLWANSKLASWFFLFNNDIAELMHERGWTFQSISYVKNLDQRTGVHITEHDLVNMLEAWENIYQKLPKNMREKLNLNEIVMSGIDMDEIVVIGQRFTPDMAESIRIMGQLN